jgi:protein involved in sex pheromone biosynthesis
MKTRTLATIAVSAAAVLALAGCSSEADTTSYNLSKDADNFKIHRQIVFHNDITDSYIAEVSGLCSLGNDDGAHETTVTCKIAPDKYVKEIFRMGDNTSVSSIQSEPVDADPYRYKIIFKPEQIIPDIETRTSANE